MKRRKLRGMRRGGRGNQTLPYGNIPEKAQIKTVRTHFVRKERPGRCEKAGNLKRRRGGKGRDDQPTPHLPADLTAWVADLQEASAKFADDMRKAEKAIADALAKIGEAFAAAKVPEAVCTDPPAFAETLLRAATVLQASAFGILDGLPFRIVNRDEVEEAIRQKISEF